MALQSELESIGMTPSEIKTYKALLELGPSTTGPVIRHTELQNSVVYRALDKLAAKGLVGFAQINGTRRYTAEKPARILDYLDERKNLLKNELGQLERLAGTAGTMPKAALFEGIRGVKNVWGDDTLNLPRGSTIYVVGAPPRSIGLELYFRNYHKKRAAKGINYKITFQRAVADVARLRAASPLLEARLMPKGFDSPMWFGVIGKRAIIGVWTKEPIMLVIDDAEVANGLMQYFNFLWKLSEPVATKNKPRK